MSVNVNPYAPSFDCGTYTGSGKSIGNNGHEYECPALYFNFEPDNVLTGTSSFSQELIAIDGMFRGGRDIKANGRWEADGTFYYSEEGYLYDGVREMYLNASGETRMRMKGTWKPEAYDSDPAWQTAANCGSFEYNLREIDGDDSSANAKKIEEGHSSIPSQESESENGRKPLHLGFYRWNGQCIGDNGHVYTASIGVKLMPDHNLVGSSNYSREDMDSVNAHEGRFAGGSFVMRGTWTDDGNVEYIENGHGYIYKGVHTESNTIVGIWRIHESASIEATEAEAEAELSDLDNDIRNRGLFNYHVTARIDTTLMEGCSSSSSKLRVGKWQGEGSAPNETGAYYIGKWNLDLREGGVIRGHSLYPPSAQEYKIDGYWKENGIVEWLEDYEAYKFRYVGICSCECESELDGTAPSSGTGTGDIIMGSWMMVPNSYTLTNSTATAPIEFNPEIDGKQLPGQYYGSFFVKRMSDTDIPGPSDADLKELSIGLKKVHM